MSVFPLIGLTILVTSTLVTIGLSAAYFVALHGPIDEVWDDDE